MKIRQAQSEDVGTVWIINDARRAEDVESVRIINYARRRLPLKEVVRGEVGSQSGNWCVPPDWRYVGQKSEKMVLMDFGEFCVCVEGGSGQVHGKIVVVDCWSPIYLRAIDGCSHLHQERMFAMGTFS